MAESLNLDPSSSVEHIMKKRKTVIRRSNPSRQRSYRAVNETRKKWSSQEGVRRQIQEPKIFRTCCRCLFQSIDSRKFLPINSMDTNNIPKSHAFNGKFLECTKCLTKPQEASSTLQPRKNLVRIAVDDRNVLVPTDNSLKKSCRLFYPPTVLVPTSVPFQSYWEEDDPPEFRNDLLKVLNQKVGSCSMTSEQFLAAGYEHFLARILKREDPNLVKGHIVSETERIIKAIPFTPNLKNVSGTTDHQEHLLDETNFLFARNGTLSVEITIVLDKEEDTVWHQFLRTENKCCVTVEEINGKRSFTVHEEHNNDEPCLENCLKMSLEDYLVSRNLRKENLEEPHMSVLLAEHYERKFMRYTSYCRNLFDASEYQSVLHFPLQKEPYLKMVVWPKTFKTINQKIATGLPLSGDDISSIQQAFGDISSTKLDIKEFLGEFSDTESKDLEKLAKTEQYNKNTGFMPSNFDLISLPPYPRSDITWELPESINFTQTFIQLQEYFIMKVNSLDSEVFAEESSTTLDDVLRNWEAEPDFCFEMSMDDLRIKFQNRPELVCKVDKVLHQMLSESMTKLSALYHRSLTISSSHEFFIHIPKRELLKKCRVVPYKPELLVISKSLCHVRIIGKNHRKVANSLVITEKAVNEELSPFKIDHEEVTLINTVFYLKGLSLKTLKRSNSSTFCNPLPSAANVFQSVTTYLEGKHFTNLNDGSFWAFVPGLYNLYLDRKDNRELCFMQFAQYYEKQTGKQESRQTQSQEDGEFSDIKVVTLSECSNTCLPNSIETNQGRRLIKLNHKKIVCHNTNLTDGEEFMHLMVCFYFPHSQIVESESVSAIFQATSEEHNGERNLKVIEQKLFPEASRAVYENIFM